MCCKTIKALFYNQILESASASVFRLKLSLYKKGWGVSWGWAGLEQLSDFTIPLTFKGSFTSFYPPIFISDAFIADAKCPLTAIGQFSLCDIRDVLTLMLVCRADSGG